LSLSKLLENPYFHGAAYGVVIVTVLMTITAYSIWFERKFAGRMQSRVGPTLVGPVGLLQPIADAVKLLQKEDIVPAKADKVLFNLAPFSSRSAPPPSFPSAPTSSPPISTSASCGSWRWAA
jgi:NADH-quinone oxidoreductase subunit H